MKMSVEDITEEHAQGRGSNGNSGVVDAGGNAAAAAKRETHDASMRGTAQGKHKALVEPTPDAPLSTPVPKRLDTLSSAPLDQQWQNHEAPSGQPAAVGFRAWVDHSKAAGSSSPCRHSSSTTLKRKASCGPPELRLPTAASCTRSKPNGLSLPASSAAMKRFSSGKGKGNSDGTTTNFGAADGTDGSASARLASSAAETAVSSMPQSASYQLQPQMDSQQAPVAFMAKQSAAAVAIPVPTQLHGAPEQTNELRQCPSETQQGIAPSSLTPGLDGSALWNSAIAQQHMHNFQAQHTQQQPQQLTAQMFGGYPGNSLYGEFSQ